MWCSFHVARLFKASCISCLCLHVHNHLALIFCVCEKFNYYSLHIIFMFWNYEITTIDWLNQNKNQALKSRGYKITQWMLIISMNLPSLTNNLICKQSKMKEYLVTCLFHHKNNLFIWRFYYVCWQEIISFKNSWVGKILKESLRELTFSFSSLYESEVSS